MQNQEGEVPSWRYIAAQGPLASTVADFWKMVVENQCSVIIMLTRTIENNHVKCADYFNHQIGGERPVLFHGRFVSSYAPCPLHGPTSLPMFQRMGV